MQTRPLIGLHHLDARSYKVGGMDGWMDGCLQEFADRGGNIGWRRGGMGWDGMALVVGEDGTAIMIYSCLLMWLCGRRWTIPSCIPPTW